MKNNFLPLYLLTIYALFSSISIAGANIGAVLAFLAWIFTINKKTYIPVFKPIIFLWFSVLLSCIFSLIPFTKSISGANEELLIIIFLVSVSAVYTRKMKYRLIYLSITSCTISAIVGILIYLETHQMSRTILLQPLHHLSVGGLMMINCLVIFPLLWIKINIKYKVAIIYSFIIILMNLIINQSRSCWLGFIAGVFHVLWFINRKAIIIFSILIVLFVIVSPHNIKNRIYSIFSYEKNKERVLIWKSSFNAFLDRPITGLGVNAFKKYYPEKYISKEAKETFQGHAHNNFLHMLCERGIIGLLAFLYVFGSIEFLLFKRFKKEENNTDKMLILGVWAALTGFLISGIFQYNYADNMIIMLLWFYLGISLNKNEMKC